MRAGCRPEQTRLQDPHWLARAGSIWSASLQRCSITTSTLTLKTNKPIPYSLRAWRGFEGEWGELQRPVHLSTPQYCLSVSRESPSSSQAEPARRPVGGGGRFPRNVRTGSELSAPINHGWWSSVPQLQGLSLGPSLQRRRLVASRREMAGWVGDGIRASVCAAARICDFPEHDHKRCITPQCSIIVSPLPADLFKGSSSPMRRR